MHELTTVTVPRSMPLTTRIAEASKQVSLWLETLEEPFDHERNKLLLTRCDRTPEEFLYHYAVINRKELSVSAVNSAKNEQAE